jgi:hypothetical protein
MEKNGAEAPLSPSAEEHWSVDIRWSSVKWALQCDEGSLRDVFHSLGGEAADLMLDAVEGGVVIEVTSGGNPRKVADRESALALLREKFGWPPDAGHRGAAQPAGRNDPE